MQKEVPERHPNEHNGRRGKQNEKIAVDQGIATNSMSPIESVKTII